MQLAISMEAADEVTEASCFMVEARARSKIDPLLLSLTLLTEPGELGDEALIEATDGGCCCCCC